MGVFSGNTSPTSSPTLHSRATAISRVIHKYPEPPPLPVGAHRDGVFGATPVGLRMKSRHPERDTVRLRQQRHRPIVIDVGEPFRDGMA